MPIRPENKDRYPKNWKEIRSKVLARAASCENCGAKNYHPNPVTKSKVVLTIAHLDHTPENNDLVNLKALCQLCHNRYDLKFRLKNRKKNAAKLKRSTHEMVRQ